MIIKEKEKKQINSNCDNYVYKLIREMFI